MISTLDIIIIVVYIIGLLILGWFVGKDNKNQEDYFLAGRSMPWLPVGLSVAATMISANGFIGAPGWAYGSGLSPYMVNIGVPLAVFFVMFTTMPVLYQLKVTSIYEYVELRLGIYSRMLTVIGFIANSIIQISSMVFVPALIIKHFTGWSLTLVVPIVVISAIIYTLLGGIKAVIWTDALQMLVMWLGLILTIIIILNKTNLGFFETLSQAQALGKMNALDFSFDISKTNAFWATLFGGTVMWIRYFGFDQGQVQRIFTSKSMKGIKRSFLASALVMNVMYFLFMVLGVMLFVFYEGKTFDTANEVMIDFISQHLPIGLVGLIVAGVFAAAMSSVDSLLNAMTTVYVKDIHERFFSKKDEEASLKFSMMISSIWGLVIIAVTLMAFSGTTRSILDVVGSYISYISGPMCGAFFLALFTLRAGDKGVAIGVVLGFVTTYLFSTLTDASWIWNPGVGMISTFIFGYFMSLCFKKKDVHPTYTVLGLRRNLIDKGEISEDGASLLPLKMDFYAGAVFLFFISQYLLLAIIAR